MENDKEFDEILGDILNDRLHIVIAQNIESLGNITLYPRQIEYIKFLNDNWNQNQNEIIINKSRQSGVTTITNLFLIDKCTDNKDKYVILLMGNMHSTRESLSFIYNRCLEKRIPNSTRGNDSIIINGNLITTKLNQEFIYDKKCVVIYDEYASIDINKNKKLENLIDNSFKDVSRVYISTPKHKNHFYQKWTDNESDIDSRFIMNWKDVPHHTSKWKDYIIDVIGTIGFEREYNNSFI